VDEGEHLFRREAGRMVVSLTRIFGVQNLDLAQDVVQDTFCRALEVWKQRGMPKNPAAWLMQSAKNRAIDVLRRERAARSFEPELSRSLQSEWTLVPTVNQLLEQAGIEDDQLRMMFSCCQPRVSAPAQIALVLNVLCGFSAAEIAHAFLTGQAAIEKRIQRAKKVLASTRGLFDLSDRDFERRLASVQRVLYLLFSEGYHSASPSAAVRTDLCLEAMRLARLLRDHPLTATPSTLALCALMHLNAARLRTRLDATGELSPLAEQDRSLWDRALIQEGVRLLERSAHGDDVSEYHVEAAIAAAHAQAPSVERTDWPQIIALYDVLLRIRSSPVGALNRAIAVAQAHGPARGLAEIRAIPGRTALASYPFYHAALGELEARRERFDLAAEHFRRALKLAHNDPERRYLARKIAASESKPEHAAVAYEQPST
jgi:RNA polymerase sigma factor (sigma-70 family)